MKSELLGEILLKEGLISPEQLQKGLNLNEQTKYGEKIGAVLVRLGYITEAYLLKALSQQFSMQVIRAGEYPDSPPELAKHPTAKFLKEYRVVPVDVKNGVLRVATANPQDPYPAEALSTLAGMNVEMVLGSEKEIMDVIEAYYGGGAVTTEKIIEGMHDKDSDGAVEDVEQLKDMALEAPIINLVNLFITRAAEKRASDIHIEPYEDVVHVRYRIDGVLYLIETLPRKLQAAVASRIKIMAKLNIAERRLPQDGRIKLKAAGKDVDIRVSTIPTLYGESIVMRILDSKGVVTLEDIGFSNTNRKYFEDLIRQPHGMILVTGPTGSGKSTTLYAALSKIKTGTKKIITVEDPIEYNLEGVNQIQVKPKIGLTFANGLRSIVRQDPDVIMVGEIRDTETAEIAIHAALTGHLILSTLHTNDAPGAATRLVDMGVESYLISSSLIGVLAQRLVRMICQKCKVPHNLTPQETKLVTSELERTMDIKPGAVTVFKGAGCPECDNTGYRGRIGIFELMPVNDAIRHHIAEKKPANVIRAAALESGMTTLRDDGWNKVLGGLTTLEEISRVTMDIDSRIDRPERKGSNAKTAGGKAAGGK